MVKDPCHQPPALRALIDERIEFDRGAGIILVWRGGYRDLDEAEEDVVGSASWGKLVGTTRDSDWMGWEKSPERYRKWTWRSGW
jgi:hypothetical protein